MTKAGVKAYRRKNPGSKLKTAVTGKVKAGSASCKAPQVFCARSAGQMKKFPKAAKIRIAVFVKHVRGGNASRTDWTDLSTSWYMA